MYCRRCGASLHQGVVICSECGARQRRGLSAVHCARCNGRVSLGLTVCPHCGRDVHPAGPRWSLWFAGFAVVIVAALWGLGALPVERVAEQITSIETRVAGIIKVFGPSGGRGTSEPSPTPQMAALSKPTATMTPTRRPTRTPTEELVATIAPAEEITATAALTSTETITATVALTATVAAEVPSATPTLEPTATPPATETPTLVPTETPTAIPTNTPVPGRTTYKVKSGDTLSSIAGQFDISWQDLAAANGLNSRSTLRVGQELIVPLPGGNPAPAPTSAPAEAPTTYTVKSGDSLSAIATRFGITWQALAQANGLTGSSRLNVGQKLIIPSTGGSSQVAPSSTPAQVAVAPTGTPTAAPTAAPPQLPGPVLVSPGDQTPYSGASAYIELVWEQSADLPAGAQYQVLLRWSEGGAPMEYSDMRTTAKSIRMPLWLYGKADQPSRQYTWSVRVVQSVTDGQGGQKDILLSPSSASRVLYWN
jgi:LysM repeat protein